VTERIATLDPVKIYDLSSRNVAIQIYEGLLGVDHDLKIIPLLAENWEVKAKEIVFHLRRGVRFHDDPVFPDGKGREFTAEDVKYSFQRVLQKENQSPWTYVFNDVVLGAQAYFDGNASGVEGFRIIDKHTFSIRLTRPFSPMIERLTTAGVFIVPHEAVEKYGKSFSFHPVGTGPFRARQVNPDSLVSLEKHQGYWQAQRPYLDRVEIRILRDANIQLLEFQKGGLDSVEVGVTQFSEVFNETGGLKSSFAQYTVTHIPLMNLKFIAFNAGQTPYGKDRRLREAINLAIDRKALAEFILKRQVVIAKSIIPPGVPGHDSNLPNYEYDMDRAAQLVAAAGYPGGKGLPPLELSFESNKEKEYVAAAIQDMTKKIGVMIKLNILPEPQLLEKINRGNYMSVLGYWYGDYPDAEQFLLAFDSKNLPPNGFNLARFTNAEFDKIYHGALEAIKVEDRHALYRRAERVALESLVWLPLYHNETFLLSQPKLKGLRINALQYKFYKDAWLAQ
jgi:ABC-type transport system substrate-binding protein